MWSQLPAGDQNVEGITIYACVFKFTLSKYRKCPDSISSIKSSSLFSKANTACWRDATAFLMTCIFTLSWILLLRFCLASKRLSTFPFDNQRTMLCKKQTGIIIPNLLQLPFHLTKMLATGFTCDPFPWFAIMMVPSWTVLEAWLHDRCIACIHLIIFLCLKSCQNVHWPHQAWIFWHIHICEWFSILYCCSISRKVSQIWWHFVIPQKTPPSVHPEMYSILLFFSFHHLLHQNGLTHITVGLLRQLW